MSLHVKGFRLGTTIQEVIDFFVAQTGQQVKGAKITNTGAVLVSFADRETARVAKERINGALFNGRELEAYYFEPRELRELQQLKLMDQQASEAKRSLDIGSLSAALSAGGSDLNKIDQTLVGILGSLLG